MSSKSLVLQAINGQSPSRVPLLYANRDLDKSDVACAGYTVSSDFVYPSPNMTEWGFRWTFLDGIMSQPDMRPLVDDDAIVAYRPPDPFAPGRLSHIPDWIATNQDRFLCFALGITGFNQATFLRGFEEFLCDLNSDPVLTDRVLDFVFDFENGIIDQLKDLPLDCVKFGDDWGSQKGLIIRPEMWRKQFKQRYAEQFERVHAGGKKVWFHSCGDINDIIGDMIEIGVDVLELLQPDIFGIERLAAEFGGRVCFCCSVDHQRRAISGTRDEIFAYVRLLADQLGAKGGRYIGYIEDYAGLGMGEEQYQWICEAFHDLKYNPAS